MSGSWCRSATCLPICSGRWRWPSRPGWRWAPPLRRVLLLTARQELHGFARRIELAEIVNAGRFLLLTGFVLPLLPDTPVTDLTPITPHQVWLAMVAVCTVSYASYLLQRYVAPPGAGLLVALVGRPLFLHRGDLGAGAAGARRRVRGAAVRGGHRPRHRGDVPAAADHHLRVQSRSGDGAGTAAAGAVGAWSGDGAGMVLDRRAATGPMRDRPRHRPIRWSWSPPRRSQCCSW